MFFHLNKEKKLLKNGSYKNENPLVIRKNLKYNLKNSIKLKVQLQTH